MEAIPFSWKRGRHRRFLGAVRHINIVRIDTDKVEAAD